MNCGRPLRNRHRKTEMYVPAMFDETRVAILHDLIRKYPLGTLVTVNEQGLQANHLPFLVDPAPEPFGTLYAHVARANSIWRDVPLKTDTLAIFQRNVPPNRICAS